MSKISIIAAVDRRMGIGYQNKLLFWLPNDLKRFKALTTGNTIIMGRKTFESLPKGALPNRRNIVLSTNPATNFPGAEVFPSLEAALQSCHEKEHVYIIGGETVYRQAIELADELCLTEIDNEAPQADAFFPAIDPQIWHKSKSYKLFTYSSSVSTIIGICRFIASWKEISVSVRANPNGCSLSWITLNK